MGWRSGDIIRVEWQGKVQDCELFTLKGDMLHFEFDSQHISIIELDTNSDMKLICKVAENHAAYSEI